MFGFLNRFFPPRPQQIPAELTAQRLPLGPNCERVARWFLETQHGMTCLGKNVKTHLSKTGGRVSGEIDLIMELNDENRTIVFVEVRSRAKNWDEFGTPLSAVSAAKRQDVCHAARLWLRENEIPESRPVRFDVVGVIWPENEEPQVLYCADAFPWIEPNWRRGNIRIR